MKRIYHYEKNLALILAALILLTSVSCSAATDNSTNETEAPAVDTVQTEPSETLVESTIENLLPAENFGGRDFRISCNSKYSYEMSVEEMTGDVCNDAVFKRNAKIEDLYNVKIVPKITTFVGNDTHVTEVINTITAGVDEYDLTGVYTYLAGRAVLQGCYHSWSHVPVVDFSKKWWVQSANEAFSIGGDRYVAVGDLSITTLLLSYGVFFNQNLAADYNLPDLYETVLNGEWTIDKLRTLSADIYKDTNGDGKQNISDTFGLGVEKVTNLDVYPSAFDISLIKHDASGNPVVAINAEKFVAALEQVYALYYNNGNGTLVCDTPGDEIPAFANGNLLFVTTWVDNAFNAFREMEDDYGILPYPKFDENQEQYYTNSMDNYSLLSVPITVTIDNLGFVGHITEALTIESHNTVFPAYYDVALTDKYARDENSVEMLNIMMDGRKYDFSILHNDKMQRLPYMFRNLIAQKSIDFASSYAAIQDALETGINSLVEDYAKLQDRE